MQALHDDEESERHIYSSNVYIDSRNEPIPEQYLSQIALLDAADDGRIDGIGTRIGFGNFGDPYNRKVFVRYHLRNVIIDVWRD